MMPGTTVGEVRPTMTLLPPEAANAVHPTGSSNQSAGMRSRASVLARSVAVHLRVLADL